MSKTSPNKSLSPQSEVAGSPAGPQQSLKPIATKQLKHQLPAVESSAASGSPVARLSDSPLQPGSHQHIAQLIGTLSCQSKPSSGQSSISASGLMLADSPYQPGSRSHVAELANAVGKGSTDAHTPTHTPELSDSPFRPTSRSHVAQLAGEIAKRLQGGASSNSSTKASTPADSPFRADSGSHVAELLSSYKKAVSPESSPVATQKSVANAVPTPHSTPMAPAAVAHGPGPLQPYKPKLVGPDEPMQGPEIIHISYGSQAPFKSRTSQVAQLADHFADAKAAEAQAHHCTPDASSSGDAVATTAPAAAAVAAEGGRAEAKLSSHSRTAQAAVATVLAVPVPPPSTPSGASQRVKSPRHKPQVVAARISSNTLEGAKKQLSSTAAVECSGADVSQKAGSYLVAGSTAADSSGDGSNMNPLFRPSFAAVDAEADTLRLASDGNEQ